MQNEEISVGLNVLTNVLAVEIVQSIINRGNVLNGLLGLPHKARGSA